ncbi:hypothetical protein CsSME_00030113 [Camellia sinensis var. sinensis]
MQIIILHISGAINTILIPNMGTQKGIGSLYLSSSKR